MLSERVQVLSEQLAWSSGAPQLEALIADNEAAAGDAPARLPLANLLISAREAAASSGSSELAEAMRLLDERLGEQYSQLRACDELLKEQAAQLSEKNMQIETLLARLAELSRGPLAVRAVSPPERGGQVRVAHSRHTRRAHAVRVLQRQHRELALPRRRPRHLAHHAHCQDRELSMIHATERPKYGTCRYEAAKRRDQEVCT